MLLGKSVSFCEEAVSNREGHIMQDMRPSLWLYPDRDRRERSLVFANHSREPALSSWAPGQIRKFATVAIGMIHIYPRARVKLCSRQAVP